MKVKNWSEDIVKTITKVIEVHKRTAVMVTRNSEYVSIKLLFRRLYQTMK